jgi:hypothetical protein
MLETTKKRKRRQPGLVAVGSVALLLALALAGCKSSTSSSTSTDTTIQARILVTNTYGQSLDIYMDDVFQFNLTNGAGGTIKNVSLDTHTMTAKLAGTDTIIDTTTIDVTALTDYNYAIDRPDINVTNAFGEALHIYMDDVYRFDLVDDENRWLIDVSLSSHFLKATRVSDNSEVASITINVTQNKDYTWTIQ